MTFLMTHNGVDNYCPTKNYGGFWWGEGGHPDEKGSPTVGSLTCGPGSTRR